MTNNIVVSVSCPICGHHLAGFGTLENDALKIMAYCPLCDNEYTFEENKNEKGCGVPNG